MCGVWSEGLRGGEGGSRVVDGGETFFDMKSLTPDLSTEFAFFVFLRTRFGRTCLLCDRSWTSRWLLMVVTTFELGILLALK